MKTKAVFVSDIEALLTGGNHLASALIGILGAGDATFPRYTSSAEKARAIIKDTDHFDLWICWREIMRFRDKYSNEAKR